MRFLLNLGYCYWKCIPQFYVSGLQSFVFLLHKRIKPLNPIAVKIKVEGSGTAVTVPVPAPVLACLSLSSLHPTMSKDKAIRPIVIYLFILFTSFPLYQKPMHMDYLSFLSRFLQILTMVLFGL